MKKNLLACLLLGWQLLATGQVTAPQATALNVDAERERINQERAGHEAVYLQAERQCYSRFAVSDCLVHARKDRRLALDELRRQELILNDMARQTKAAEALKRIEDKLVEHQKKQEESAAPAQ
jgi:hypothetical protein